MAALELLASPIQGGASDRDSDSQTIEGLTAELKAEADALLYDTERW